MPTQDKMQLIFLSRLMANPRKEILAREKERKCNEEQGNTGLLYQGGGETEL